MQTHRILAALKDHGKTIFVSAVIVITIIGLSDAKVELEFRNKEFYFKLSIK